MVGDRIRAAREAAGKSIEDLARELGTGASYLGRVERGRVRPRVDTLARIAEALGLPVSALLAGRNAAVEGAPSEDWRLAVYRGLRTAEERLEFARTMEALEGRGSFRTAMIRRRDDEPALALVTV